MQINHTSTTQPSIDDLVIIDDDDLVLELLRRHLRHSGLMVQYFTDEVKALDYLRTHRVKTLILDQRMPRLDGLEIIQVLKSENIECPNRVYLCSAVTMPTQLSEQARELNTTPLLKETLRDKAHFFDLLTES